MPLSSKANSPLKIYSVGQINRLIRTALEEKLPSMLTISGEISDWKHHSSGHCYFLLKDKDGVLPCVIWADRFRKVLFSPENGMAVLATGYIDVYMAGGKYQLYAEQLAPAGIGALQLAFEQMVKRLEKEGLFRQEHKKPIPRYPMRIGIVTSRSGAAVGDITESIFNRWPCARLFLYPVPVQGEGAAKKIAAAIRSINWQNAKLRIDVVIVGRGGGSQEDLWAFNEEVVARAIFDSRVPIISAVGHEADITIADLVADARASTPTKAGVLAVPDISEVTEGLNQAQNRLRGSLRAGFLSSRQRLETILAGGLFRNPKWLIITANQQVDEAASGLNDSVRSLMEKLRRKLETAQIEVLQIEPHRILGAKKEKLSGITALIDRTVRSIYSRNELKLTAAQNRLAAMNPRSVLKRGYSITTNKRTGSVVTCIDDVHAGDLLDTELAEKQVIQSQVRQTGQLQD